mmetsp:Transcript_8007/g.19647  ORF Transcript_8007/g.19647 Transcript_8007/m.19647 type:complete len:568 (+) Transcript_8007:75-1778(+)
MLGRQSLRRLSRTLHSNKALASASNAAPPPPGTSSEQPTGSSASADPSGHQRAQQGVRRPPPSSEQQQASSAGAPKGTEGPGDKKESSSKIGWVIPVLGIPGLIGWYLYDQGLVQQEHDTYIQSLHDGIKERRQKLVGSRAAMREPQQAAPISSSLQQQEEASGLSRVSVSEGNRGNGPSLENGGTSGEAAGAGAPAGAPGAIAEGGRNGEKEDSGVGIMSAVGSMEGQEQADAGGVARDVQAAADHARAEEAAAAAAAAAAQQQREQQQQEQEQEQAAREQQRVLEEEQLRQQRVEQEERVQQQEQEQQLGKHLSMPSRGLADAGVQQLLQFFGYSCLQDALDSAKGLSTFFNLFPGDADALEQEQHPDHVPAPSPEAQPRTVRSHIAAGSPSPHAPQTPSLVLQVQQHGGKTVGVAQAGVAPEESSDGLDRIDKLTLRQAQMLRARLVQHGLYRRVPEILRQQGMQCSAPQGLLQQGKGVGVSMRMPQQQAVHMQHSLRQQQQRHQQLMQAQCMQQQQQQQHLTGSPHGRGPQEHHSQKTCLPLHLSRRKLTQPQHRMRNPLHKN